MVVEEQFLRVDRIQGFMPILYNCVNFTYDIPVFPTITATVTFQEFRYDEFDESIFTVPDDYKEDPSRFPDL
ncbi:UNVERIFIED_CONTAM: Ankyrin repeat domain-containing protein 13C [Gekko kuhli]